MKTEPIIVIEVDQDGHVSVDVSNVQGPTCKALTKELQEALGSTTSQTLKPECNAIDLSPSQKQQQSIGESL